ncbi:MAG: spore coat protein U domain-containing protein [Pseudomonadota bacterium]
MSLAGKRKQRLLLSALVAGCWLAGTVAHAQSCSATIGSLDFGQVSMASGSAFFTSAPISWSCSGIPNQTITGCINIGNGTYGQDPSGAFRRLGSGSNRINFQLYKDAAYSVPWGGWNSAIPTVGQTFTINLDGSGNGSISGSIYASILSGQTTAATGAYFSSFPGGNRRIKYDYSFVGDCSIIAVGNTSPGGNASFQVDAENITTCSVATAALDFGTVGVLNSNIDATGTVTVTCSSGTPYTVAIGGGGAGATDPTLRQMSFAVVNQITYAIYSDSGRTSGWGDSVGTNTVAGTGNGLAQDITAYGRVPPQTTPIIGTYTDTVLVTVQY